MVLKTTLQLLLTSLALSKHIVVSRSVDHPTIFYSYYFIQIFEFFSVLYLSLLNRTISKRELYACCLILAIWKRESCRSNYK